MDKISVIVPIYNSEKYLRECIESIINQTYKNIEILLIDDGSTDSSLSICKEFTEKYNYIKVFELKHQGVSQARNFGIRNATGKYICFIDSDDLVKENFLYSLINMIANNDADIAEVNFKYMNERTRKSKSKVKKYNSVQMAKRLYSKNGIRTGIITNKLFNIKLFKNISFENRENEDEFIIHKLLFATNKNIVIDNQKLYIYRIREHSRQINFKSEKLKVLDVFEERKKYFLIDNNLLKRNEIAKLDMYLYLSYVCYKNNRIKEQRRLKEEFLKEYKKLNFKPDIRRRLKYYIFKKNSDIIINIILLKNRKIYG